MGGSEHDDRLMIAEPIELNLVWFLAHVAGWCPYGLTECHMLGDPVVQSFGSGPGGGSLLTPEDLKHVWAAQVEQHVQSVLPDAVPDPFAHLAHARVRDEMNRLHERFLPWWYSNLGPHQALASFEQLTVSDVQSDPRWAFPAWRHATDVRDLLIVGTEDALLHRNRVAVVGAIALVRRGRVFELLA